MTDIHVLSGADRSELLQLTAFGGYFEQLLLTNNRKYVYQQGLETSVAPKDAEVISLRIESDS